MAFQPGDLMKAHAAGNNKAVASIMQGMKGKRKKVATPSKGELGMVMKKKRKGAAHLTSERGFGAAGDLHEEKRSKRKGKKKRKGAAHIKPSAGFRKARDLHEEKSACKICGKTTPHTHKRKRKSAKKA